MNPQLIHEEVSLIFRWLEVVRSLPPLDDFKPSENQAVKFPLPPTPHPLPKETQAGEYEVIIPAFPQEGEAGGGGGGESRDYH